jgi:hypothetical protein
VDLCQSCGAQTRRGACQGPAMANGRCRMHGGNNPGPLGGNHNAWKRGLRSAEMEGTRALARALRDGLDDLSAQ